MPNKKEEPKHVSRGGSSCERWTMCLGSTAFIEESGIKFSGNQYTAEGTIAHKVAEQKWKVARGLEQFDDAVLGSRYKQDGFTVEVSKNMLDAVQVYLDWLDEIEVRFGISKENSCVEKKVSIKHPSIVMRGTADYVGYVPYSTLVVADYKHGENVPVSVSDNFQALMYAAGALESLPEDEQGEVRNVLIAIIQPRTFATNKVQEMLIPAAEVWRFRDWIIERAELGVKGAPLTAGKWCMWCPVKGVCPEKKREALQPAKDAGLDFEGATVNIADTKKFYNSLSDADVIALWKNIPSMKAYIVGLEGRAIEVVDKQGKKLGLMTEFGVGDRTWKDEGAVAAALESLSLVAYDSKLKTPAAIDKEIQALENKDKALEVFAGLVHRPPTKVKKIVPLVEDITDGI